MTAVTKPVTFSWIPKGGGKGGQFSNATSHDADTDMLANVRNLVVVGGQWVEQVADLLFCDTVDTIGGGYPWSLHIFNSFSAAKQQYFSFLMVGYVKQTFPAGWGRGFTTSSGAFTALDAAGASVLASAFNSPTVFQTVKNRCYSCDGMTKLQAAAGLPGPRIYYDQTGLGTALVGVNWGLPTPVPNLQVSPDPASYQTGTCTTQTGSPVIITMSFDPRTNLAPGMPFYIETSAGSGQYYEFIIQTCDNATQLTMTTNWIGAGYVGAKCQGNYGSMSWGPNLPNIVTGTATTNGTVNVTTIAGFDAQVFCKVGYRFLIESQAGSQVWNTYTITSIVSATAVQVAPATVESYVGARVRVDLPATSSGISSDSSYQYAISYYDSARGHIGNPGPIFTVNWGPPFNKRINLKVQNITDAPLIAVTGRTRDWTYDKILLWRTASSGAVLQPRVLLNPAGGGGTQSFTDNLSDDTQLGQVGPVGVGITGGHLTVHGPPPDDLNFATYWENRFFGASSSNPGILYWTAIAGQEIDNYGVAEECWPPLNTLPIPESDGTITGIRTVGASLIVATQNNLYEVDYNTTNTTSIFRLKRLSAKGSGTTHFATATLPGEDAQSGDILVHFGNDKRLYLLYGAGGDIPISYPVQDIFNTITNPSQVRVGVRHDQNATYIVVMPNQGTNLAASFLPTFLYDLDRKVWLEVTTGQSCYTEGIFNGVTTGFLGGGTATQGQAFATNIYKMMSDTLPWPVGLGGQALIKTHYVTPPGVPRFDEKDCQAVIVYVDNLPPGNYPTVAVSADEGAPVNFQRLDTSATPFLRMYLDTPNCYVYVPSSALMLKGRTFQATILLPSVTSTVPRIAQVVEVWSVTVDAKSTGGVL